MPLVRPQAHADWPPDVREKISLLHAQRRPRQDDMADDARPEVVVVSGFPELARSEAVLTCLDAVLLATHTPTSAVVDRFAPYRRGNRGIV